MAIIQFMAASLVVVLRTAVAGSVIGSCLPFPAASGIASTAKQVSHALNMYIPVVATT